VSAEDEARREDDAPAPGDGPPSDEPAGDEPTSDGEAPTSDAAAGEAPTSDAAAGEAPTSDAAAGEAPTSDAAAGEAPTSDAAAGEAPTSDAAAGEAPTSDAPTRAAASGDESTPAGDAATDAEPTGDAATRAQPIRAATAAPPGPPADAAEPGAAPAGYPTPAPAAPTPPATPLVGTGGRPVPAPPPSPASRVAGVWLWLVAAVPWLLHTPARVAGLAYLALSAPLTYAFGTRVFEEDLAVAVDNPRLLLLVRTLFIVVPAYPGVLGLYGLVFGRRPPPRLNPLGLVFDGWWFASLATLTWRELRGLFYRPVAYVVLFVFLFVNGLIFGAIMVAYAGEASLGQDFNEPAIKWQVGNFFFWMTLFVICPAITMRLVAEEHRQRTLESLLTAPVTHIQVILSKFLAAMGFYLTLLAVTGLYLWIIHWFTVDWDWGPVFGAYLGLLLLGGLFMSIGVFSSALTGNQVIAFVVAALVLMGLFFAGTFFESMIPSESGRAAVRFVSLSANQQDFARGVVSFRSVVFYLTTTAFFLFLAVRTLESHRWR